MIRLKSSLMKLISIYISLLLFFSPLFGYTEREENRLTEQKTEKISASQPELLTHNQFNIVSWHITTSNGDRLEVSEVQIVNDDSLRIVSNGAEQYIFIGLIEAIAIKKESHAIKKGFEIGFVFGTVVGGLLGLSLARSLNSGSETVSVVGTAALGALIGGVPSTVVGTIIGSIVRANKGEDKIYDMTGLSTAQKRNKIQEIMNSE